MIDELTVSYKGKSTQLNLFVLIQQGIVGDQKKIDSLLHFHFQRLVIVDDMKRCDSTDRKKLHDFDFKLECLDNLLQGVWGFPMNSNHHRFWEQPHCTCHKSDDLLGMGRRINTACPVHGWE